MIKIIRSSIKNIADNKKKIISALMAIFILFFNVSNAHALNVNSSSAILMDAKTGDVLYEKNCETQRAMASTSKIMTYLLTMEAIEQGKISLDDKVKVSKNAANAGGSSYKLKANDVLTVNELINSMMIISANDSAVVLAEHVDGSVDKFRINMNQRARELGLKTAYFVNPNGMPLKNNDQNKISAKDLALLSKHVIERYGDHLLTVTSQKQFNGTYKKFSKKNTNKLLDMMPFTDGLKTGYTNSAGHCLVSTKKIEESEDNRLISVVLGGKSGTERFNDSKNMLEYGIKEFANRAVEVRDIAVYIDSDPIIFEGIRPVIENDTTLVPLRKVTESLGGLIEWHPDTRTVSGGKDNSSFILAIDSSDAIINGVSVPLLASPVIIEGKTMVPMRFIAESLGMKVDWDIENWAVMISSN